MTTPVPSGPTSDGEILVAGAGDARANGVYARCGTQNDAPRWRHVDRSWLCILRDGSSWWIGDERAAREDLYWMDAAAPGALAGVTSVATAVGSGADARSRAASSSRASCNANKWSGSSLDVGAAGLKVASQKSVSPPTSSRRSQMMFFCWRSARGVA